ncbi:unnamed protein product, partial [Ectocarpus sp. 4 AP-2014]
MSSTKATGDGEPRRLSRHERRHGSKSKPPPEPTVQIPKAAIAVAAAVLVLAAIMGVKTSLQAASNSKPFSMEGFDAKGEKTGGRGRQQQTFEPSERDTTEEDAPNGDWLEDPIMANTMGISRCDIERVHHTNMTTKRFSRHYEGVKPVIIEGLIDEKWAARATGRWSRPGLLSTFSDSPVHISSGAGIVHSGGESLQTVT